MAVIHVLGRQKSAGIPGFQGKLNYIKGAWANPCNAPLYVYVETALPVALDMLVAYKCFDFLDLVRWIFRPAGLSGASPLAGRHSRRGPRGRTRLTERIRSRIPLLKRIKGRAVSNGVKHLWRLDELGQRLLYWWMVADITATGAYNFTSIIYKTAWCQLSAAGNKAAATAQGLNIGNVIPETITPWAPDYNVGETGINLGTVHLGPGRHRVIAGVSGTPNPVSTPRATLILAVIGGPDAGQHVLDSDDDFNPDEHGLIGAAELDGGVDVFVQVQTDTGGNLENWTAHVVAYNTTPILPPDQMGCAWEKYFQILPDGAIEKITDDIMPPEIQEWWDRLPASQKA